MESKNLIPLRLRSLREKQRVSQAALADKLGFNDRQTISKIESRERKISAQELVAAAEFFKVPLDYFTDPFRLDGEARFSWRRQTSISGEKLELFELKAARWIALFRELERGRGNRPSSILHKAPLRADSSFEDASSVAEDIGRQLKLGDIPSERLLTSVENLGTLVLFVDAAHEVSGAACQLSPLWALNVILINRNEASYRRNYDLAHEFFHLLTWDVLPPERFESVKPTGNEKRVEQLADNFAAGMLMPTYVLKTTLESRKDREIHEWINTSAENLGVSSIALKHRLLNASFISTSEYYSIDATKLKNHGQKKDAVGKLPALFSRRYMDTLNWGISEGRISVRRACGVLDLTVEELRDAFEGHGIPVPFDL